MVTCILRASLSFFAVNPVGRIMNRFSQDISSLGDFFPVLSFQSFIVFLRIVATIIFLVMNNPTLIPSAFVLVLMFFIVTRFYCRSGLDLKRIMSIACGPVYSHFSNTMDGIKSIRVHQREKKFMEALYDRIDAHNQTMFAYYPAVRWFGLTLDIICLIFVTIVLLVVVFTMNESSNPALLGLGVIYVCSFADVAQYGIRLSTEVHSIMTSAERTLAYTKIPCEKGYDVTSEPPKYWPNEGKISFKDVSLSYYEGGPKVLRSLTFKINPSEKVGIAGRTGAGKSSLVAAMMRLCECDGQIFIDGFNNKEVNVQKLRHSISVISQSPLLMSGRLRVSLDPHGEFTDPEIWDALDHMQMKRAVANLPDQLDTIVQGTGSNFSVGERQLLHLARVLLQKSKVLIFDEATANVDLKKDEIIQEIIRREFKECTVVTIAHRLNTILDCDRVMLMDHGEIVEFDDPKILLANENSLFSKFYEISR